jgi:hypothetical protein
MIWWNIVLLLLLSIFQKLVNGWGEEGHKIVAQLATNMLTSSTKNQIQKFIGNSGIDLAGMAPLPDEYDHTSEGRWSSHCHYCNLPRDATNFIMDYCPNYCVVKSINNYTDILKNSQPYPCNFDQKNGVEPCALEFLVHFIGDVHQPLHVGYGYDEGGNTVKVYWYSERVNLHEVWDTKMIEKWNRDYLSATDELQQMIKNDPSIVKKYLRTMDPVQWADESFQYVLDTVYNFTEGFSSNIRLNEPQLGDIYYQKNIPIVKERLIAGGVRLGHSLNILFNQFFTLKN